VNLALATIEANNVQVDFPAGNIVSGYGLGLDPQTPEVALGSEILLKIED